jgi:hypothetical protein
MDEASVRQAMLEVLELDCWANPPANPPIIDRRKALAELRKRKVKSQHAKTAFGRHLALGNLGVMPGPGTVFYATERMREWQRQQVDIPRMIVKQSAATARAGKDRKTQDRQQEIIRAVAERLKRCPQDSVDYARHRVVDDHRDAGGWSYSTVNRATKGMNKNSLLSLLTLTE